MPVPSCFCLLHGFPQLRSRSALPALRSPAAMEESLPGGPCPSATAESARIGESCNGQRKVGSPGRGVAARTGRKPHFSKTHPGLLGRDRALASGCRASHSRVEVPRAAPLSAGVAGHGGRAPRPSGGRVKEVVRPAPGLVPRPSVRIGGGTLAYGVSSRPGDPANPREREASCNEWVRSRECQVFPSALRVILGTCKGGLGAPA